MAMEDMEDGEVVVEVEAVDTEVAEAVDGVARGGDFSKRAILSQQECDLGCN